MKQLQADSIKKSILPSDFYRHELPGAILKKSGWNNGGLCPFHQDKAKGSFFINLQTGAYHCFSCGSTGSGVIDFTMTLYGLEFLEALQKLSDEWGVI